MKTLANRELKPGTVETKNLLINQLRHQGKVDPTTGRAILSNKYYENKRKNPILTSRNESPPFPVEHEYVPIETSPSRLAPAVRTVAISSSRAAVSQGRAAEAPLAQNLPDSLNPIRKIAAKEPLPVKKDETPPSVQEEPAKKE